MTQIKIHDVLHDPVDFDAKEIEKELLIMHKGRGIDNIRIAKGHSNSPIFITLSENRQYVSVKSIEQITRFVLTSFSRRVSGVDVEKCLGKKDNIKITVN